MAHFYLKRKNTFHGKEGYLHRVSSSLKNMKINGKQSPGSLLEHHCSDLDLWYGPSNHLTEPLYCHTTVSFVTQSAHSHHSSALALKLRVSLSVPSQTSLVKCRHAHFWLLPTSLMGSSGGWSPDLLSGLRLEGLCTNTPLVSGKTPDTGPDASSPPKLSKVSELQTLIRKQQNPEKTETAVFSTLNRSSGPIHSAFVRTLFQAGPM